MNGLSSHARELQELLDLVLVRIRDLRVVQLVDRDGLPLVSTLRTGALDEALAAIAGGLAVQCERAQRECDTGPLHVVHVIARDRQIVLCPVTDGLSLVAIADAGATSPTLERHLFALSREVLSLMIRQPEATP